MSEPKVADETPLTAAELAELKSKDLEIARLEAETAKVQQRIREQDKELADIRTKQAWNAAIEDVGVKFHVGFDSVKKLLLAEPGTEIVPSADGSELIATKDGNPTTVKELLVQLALTNQNLVDGRTLKRYQTPDTIKSRAELKTTADKLSFIERHGLKAFESLPLRAPEDWNIATMTRNDWLKLPTSERARLSGEIGEEGIALILQRKG